jgi:hypothetical protein
MSEPQTTWKQRAAFVHVVAVVWVASALLWLVEQAPVGLPGVLVSIAWTAGTVALVVWRVRQAWFGRVFTRSACTVLAASALFWLFSLYSLPGEGLADVGFILVLLGSGAVIGLTTLVLVWWRPVDSLVALALVVAMGFVVANSAAVERFGQRRQVELLGSAYRREARALIARPPSQRIATEGDRLVLRDAHHRRPVVFWVQGEGLPARTYGLAYDPERALRSGSQMVSDRSNTLSGGLCDRIEGPWFWCEIN